MLRFSFDGSGKLVLFSFSFALSPFNNSPLHNIIWGLFHGKETQAATKKYFRPQFKFFDRLAANPEFQFTRFEGSVFQAPIEPRIVIDKKSLHSLLKLTGSAGFWFCAFCNAPKSEMLMKEAEVTAPLDTKSLEVRTPKVNAKNERIKGKAGKWELRTIEQLVYFGTRCLEFARSVEEKDPAKKHKIIVDYARTFCFGSV